MKRTNWYPPTMLPVRVGVYECEWVRGKFGGIWFNYWNGTSFLLGSQVAQFAAYTEGRKRLPFDRLKRWRGVRK